MRILKKYCDHCHKEILDDMYPTAEINLFNYRSVSKRAKDLDLCPDCAVTLYDFMYPKEEKNDVDEEKRL